MMGWKGRAFAASAPTNLCAWALAMAATVVEEMVVTEEVMAVMAEKAEQMVATNRTEPISNQGRSKRRMVMVVMMTMSQKLPRVSCHYLMRAIQERTPR